ncbi:methyl-accepting chemotaxis protein [Terribacillus sp. 7520-G]|uniref:methyl-accepting chemotaxis protein n=1 Tax=Terribacillus sp. 7520-G TaxID=2025389 RepID=UPI000BA7DE1B|nr:methyl-accepting chemotaxis protein [Terribacillus sp. 7520-G]PAD39532.1 histidine kinase [Terribacillus sp. 7520-G]
MPVDLNREHLFTALERAVAMIVFDSQGKIAWANNNFSQVVGYSTEELQRMHHRELCPRAFSASRDYEVFWENLRANKLYHNKVERVRKDGSTLWLDAFYTPVINAEGKVDSIIKIATDITNQENILKSSSSEFMSLVKEMNQSTNEVHRSSESAVTDMGELIEEFDVVKDNINEIKTMASTVKGIADQSNLLGLNASIEAARAGEHGKGFSVVANEVRKMADTSKSSAEDISKQLLQITQSMEAMSEMVNQVMDSIHKNYGTIGELKNAYENIAKTAERLSEMK